MNDLSEHFSRSEFACQCGCGFNTVDVWLLELLEGIHSKVHERYSMPVRIKVTSGCRCRAHNAAEGGGEHSQHLFARAADIVVMVEVGEDIWERVDPVEVADIAHNLGAGGVGTYSSFTHVDSRTHEVARW